MSKYRVPSVPSGSPGFYGDLGVCVVTLFIWVQVSCTLFCHMWREFMGSLSGTGFVYLRESDPQVASWGQHSRGEDASQAADWHPPGGAEPFALGSPISPAPVRLPADFLGDRDASDFTEAFAEREEVARAVLGVGELSVPLWAAALSAPSL